MPRSQPEESYKSIEDYLAQLELRRTKEEAPTAAIFLLGSHELLRLDVNGLPWINRIRCELPRRPAGPNGEEPPVVATYVDGYGPLSSSSSDGGRGGGDGDGRERGVSVREELAAIRYGLVKRRLGLIGVSSVHRIDLHSEGRLSDKSLRGLEQSDLVIIDVPPERFESKSSSVVVSDDEDGYEEPPDQVEAWRKLSPPEMGGRSEDLAERIKWRYYLGSVLIGIGGGASLLGRIGFRRPTVDLPDEPIEIVKSFQIVPAFVGNDRNLLSRVSIESIGDTVAFVLPNDGGLIFNTDGSFEPVHGFVTELTTTYNTKRRSSSEEDGEGGPNASYLCPPETDENVMVCTRWLRERGMTSVADVVDEDDDDIDDDDTGREPTEGEARLGLPPRPLDPRVLARMAADSEERRTKGVERFKSSEHDAALIEFRAARIADPYDVRPYLNESLCLVKLGRAREAVSAADAALWLTDGTDAKAWFRRAQAFHQCDPEEFNEALSDVEASLSIVPGDKGSSKLKKTLKEDRETGCWSYNSDSKKGDVEGVLLMEELEKFDGTSLEIHDGELHYEWDTDRHRREKRKSNVPDLDQRALWSFQETTKRRNLTRISLKGCRLTPWGASFVANGARDAANENASNLRFLSLSNCRLRDEGCGTIATLIARGVPIVELDLSSNGLGSAGLKKIADALRDASADETPNRLMTLETLNLSNNRIDDGGMGTFSKAVSKCSSIRTVDLSSNRINFRAVAHLSESLIKPSRSIERLYLSNHSKRLRVDALWRLAGVGIGHPSLRVVDLRGVKLSYGDWIEMMERTKYKAVQFKLSRPKEAAVVVVGGDGKKAGGEEEVETESDSDSAERAEATEARSDPAAERKKEEEEDGSAGEGGIRNEASGADGGSDEGPTKETETWDTSWRNLF